MIAVCLRHTVYLLTLGAHAQRGLRYLVCVSVTRFFAHHALQCAQQDIPTALAGHGKGFKFGVFCRPFFTTFEHAHTDTWQRGHVVYLLRDLWTYSYSTGGIQVCMHLRKVCPQCNTILHARRSVCGCGHAFPLKRKGQCIS